MNKAIFLDRDGTINVDVHCLHEIENLQFIDGVPKALSRLKQSGYKLIVISNQSGIARGYYGIDEVERLHKYMNDRLLSMGARIDAFYYCPHDEKANCECRKPKPGLIKKAAAEWDIDLEQSYMVGDKETDVIAAQNAGCGYGLLLSGHDVSDEVVRRYSGHIYKNLGDFAEMIEKGALHADE